jgi:predicted AAA+ superfamily ATPase
MIDRDITEKLLSSGRKFPIVTLTGPRQSGKSTLLKSVLTDYNYVSMEDPDNRLVS